MAIAVMSLPHDMSVPVKPFDILVVCERWVDVACVVTRRGVGLDWMQSGLCKDGG